MAVPMAGPQVTTPILPGSYPPSVYCNYHQQQTQQSPQQQYQQQQMQSAYFFQSGLSNGSKLCLPKKSLPQTKGLLNMPGQNNCFLNSAVQVLWHLDIFRRSFRELSGHACMGLQSCIFCALKELFTQFQYSQETALPPDALRRALAETFSDQRRFQLGFMDDAAECFENMLLRMHYHLANQEPEDHRCSAPHCISHKKFAMNLVEQIICSSCGATSEALPFTQMVHYVSTPALCHQAKKIETFSYMSFGELLKSAGALGDVRDCPKSCGARVQIKKTLCNKPDIVSIGLVWDSERPSINHISDVFQLIGTSLRFQDIFDYQYNGPKAGIVQSNKPSGQKSGAVLQLVGIVTYYGKHYSTFFYHTKLETWIYFDDATVREIGPHWEQVVEKCIRGHFQPLLLLYANPNGTPVDTSTAPKSITAMPNPNKNAGPKPVFHLKAPPKMNTANGGSTRMGQFMHPMSVPMGLQTNHVLRNHHLQQVAQNRGYRPSRQGSVDDLLNTYASASEDVPDSPLTKSSTSSAYFSDIGEVDSGYISRRTIENILSLQRTQQVRQPQRSSTSSTESFVEINEKARKAIEEKRDKLCSLQRRDSGNSSNSSGGGGDRNSSSGSSVASDHQYFGFTQSVKRQLSNLPGLRNPANVKERINSDCGYDSFSLSSSDSYPAVGGPPSPIKHNQFQHPRLSQIPEDIHFMDLGNNGPTDCDQLCSEADMLLLKSHEKEREGDIRVAAVLSDSAAQKARSAMDAPYSNPQMLITAKMKHSMCVMRSASLHRRVKEAEAEEKRRLKAESLEILHSRQNSRDSNRGRHSRQNSKDGSVHDEGRKDGGPSEQQHSVKTMELYGTLPKKNAKKKLAMIDTASLRIREAPQISVPPILDSLKSAKKPDKCRDNKSDIESVCSSHTSSTKRLNSKINLETYFSDYYSEVEVRQPSKIPVRRSSSGTSSCRENDSETYGDLDGMTQVAKKQHRIRRKLLLGSFMKRRNRSLPDLREGTDQDLKEQEVKSKDDSMSTKSVAQVSRRGFHKVHALCDKGLTPKMSLVKVNIPQVDLCDKKQSAALGRITDVEKATSPQTVAAAATPARTPTVSTSSSIASAKSASTTCTTSSTVSSNISAKSLRVSCPQLMKPTSCSTPPPPPEVVPEHKIPYSQGIEPNDELPPPPDDFLLELREKRKQMLDCSLMNQLLGQRAMSDYDEFDSCTKPKSQESPKLGHSVCKADPRIEAGVDEVDGVCRPRTENVSKSVKDLASKFEKLAAKPTTVSAIVTEQMQSQRSLSVNQCINKAKVPNLTSNSPLPVVNRSPTVFGSPPEATTSIRSSTSSGGLRVVALLGTNLKPNSDHVNSPGQHGHMPQASSLIPPPSPSPSVQSGSINCNRPDKPPDYQTAMKRLGLRKVEMTSMLQQNRLSNSSLNGYSALPTSPPTPVQYTSEHNQVRTRQKSGTKKSVSFSDEVVLVASAEAEEEEHFPNPLLERVLAKSNILAMANNTQEKATS